MVAPKSKFLSKFPISKWSFVHFELFKFEINYIHDLIGRLGNFTLVLITKLMFGMKIFMP
jgi:hypothetical protein